MTIRMLIVCLCIWSSLAAQAAVRIYPQPKQMEISDAKLVLPKRPVVVYRGQELRPCAELLSHQIAVVSGTSVAIREQGTGTIVLALKPGLRWKDGYTLVVSATGVAITGQSVRGVFSGVQSLGWLIRAAGERKGPDEALVLPGLRVRDWPDIQIRAMTLQWCYAVPSKEVVNDTARVLAALKYSMIVPEFGPNLVSDRWPKLFNAKSWVTREEFRKYVAYCRQQGLEVVPYLNSLGHVDRGMPWPTRLGNGLDMGDEQNYRALFDVLAECLEDCPGARYLHLGMDEAIECLSENAKKYGKSPAELLAGHVDRLMKFCRERKVTPVIYHDMLLGSDEKMYWREGVANGTTVKSYLARPRIDREIVLDYWNYEAFGRYRTVEEFQKEGFKHVWLTPWGGQAVYTMPQNAYAIGAGIMGSTWSDVDYIDTFTEKDWKGRWTIYTRRWLTDALATLAEAAWDIKAPTTPTYDPSLIVDSLYWDRPAYGQAEKCVLIRPADKADPAAAGLARRIMDMLHLKPGKQYLKGMAFDITPDHVLALGNIQDLSEKDVVAMMAQPKPWVIYLDGKKDKAISQINVPRAGDQLILYTRGFGRTTGTNGYGREVNVRCGRTHYGDDWGVGNMAIPRNGYVLSAHGEGLYGCEAVNGYRNIKIVDAAGREVPLGKRSASGADATTISVNRKAKRLVFLQTTAFEAAHFMPYIAAVTVRYVDGTSRDFNLRYGRDICSYDDVSFLYGEKNKWMAAAEPGKGVNNGKLLYAYEWENPSPDRPILSVQIKLSDLGRRIGYLLLGLTAVSQDP